MKWAYYNEFDKHAAAWLRELIKRGLITDGEVDERSICDVKPDDIRGFRRVHFFAGIAGWELALKLAGWPEELGVWTGSCPCQPFSSAGKGLAQADERHLWPVMFNLIRECRPDTVIGEQVASAIGKGWLDGISADLETEKYACGHCVLGAHSLSSPHKRQRLYWVANAAGGQRQQFTRSQGDGVQRSANDGAADEAMADSESRGSQNDWRHDQRNDARWEGDKWISCSSCTHILPHSQQQGLEGHAGNAGDGSEPRWIGAQAGGSVAQGGGDAGFWSDFDIVHFTDGKQMRIEPCTSALAHGIPRGVVPSCDISASYAQNTGEARVMRLRGYGNSIVPQVAAEFIKAFMSI